MASGRRRRTFLALRLRRREGDVHQFRGAAADGTASQRRTPAVALAPPPASAMCTRCTWRSVSLDVSLDDVLPFIDVGSQPEKSKDIWHEKVAVLSGGSTMIVLLPHGALDFTMVSFVGGLLCLYQPPTGDSHALFVSFSDGFFSFTSHSSIR